MHPLFFAGTTGLVTWGLLRLRADAILSRIRQAPSLAVTPEWEMEARRLHRSIKRSRPWDLGDVWRETMSLERIAEKITAPGQVPREHQPGSD